MESNSDRNLEENKFYFCWIMGYNHSFRFFVFFFLLLTSQKTWLLSFLGGGGLVDPGSRTRVGYKLHSVSGQYRSRRFGWSQKVERQKRSRYWNALRRSTANSSHRTAFASQAKLTGWKCHRRTASRHSQTDRRPTQCWIWFARRTCDASPPACLASGIMTPPKFLHSTTARS